CASRTFCQFPASFRNRVWRGTACHTAQLRSHLRIVVHPHTACFAIRDVRCRLTRQWLAIEQRGNAFRSLSTIHFYRSSLRSWGHARCVAALPAHQTISTSPYPAESPESRRAPHRTGLRLLAATAATAAP